MKNHEELMKEKYGDRFAEEMERRYGAAYFNGKKYILTDMPLLVDRPFDFYPQFMTSAIDETERKCYVYFNVKNEYVEQSEDGMYTIIFDEDMEENYENLCNWDVIDEVAKAY